MKRIILLLVVLISQLCLTMPVAVAQSMSDQQVIQFIQSEAQAGTSQSQIVTKLMQRGVKIEQIRRLRNQYDKQISERGLSGAADGAVSMAAERMRGNSDGTTSQELTTARRGTTGEVYSDAAEEVKDVEHDVKATQGTAPTTNGKRVFGRDIFSQANPSFQPNVNMPIPDTYVLGVGDQLVIDIYGASQQTMMYTISPEGTITVTGYGPIYLSGLTVAAAQKKLRSTIGSRFQSSNLQLTIGNTRTIQVNIMGEVRAPGTYRLSAFANVLYAIYRAGGTSSLGTLRNIKVYRNEKVVAVVDLYDFILNGRMSGNVNLQDNDIIQVGIYDRLVGITGSVRRPMFYEMREDETVATLINYAGDFTGDANKKTVRLVRQNGERYQVYNVEEDEFSRFRLEDGDAVTVDGMINRYENMVEIKGAVFRPGLFRLNSNLTSVRDLIEAADGLTEDAFTARAVLHRLKEDRSLMTISVDIQGIMNGTVADIPLKNEDVLFIPTEKDLRVERTFTITGEVMSPGTYEYADNTTIEDLIVMAGGLTDMASTGKVDISRRIRDPKSTQKSNRISENFTLSLKDGLVIDGDQGFILEPYDVVHVRRSPGYASPRSVYISGEVVFEGSFTLSTRNQRLSDLVQAAGGLTEDAYVRGARLERAMNAEERARLKVILDIMRRNVNFRDSLDIDQLATASTYIVGIDLEKALAKPGSDCDIVLREGDRLIVPEYNGMVKISGNVLYPNTVTYQAGKSWKSYVNQAGGFGLRSRKSHSFIVYQNGTVSQVGKGKIEPGCELIVPMRGKPDMTGLMAFASLSTTFASLATMVATVANLLK